MAAAFEPVGFLRSATLRDWLQSAARVVFSFLFFCRGLQGLGLFGGIDHSGVGAAFGQWPDWYAAIIELVGSAFVLVGLFSRTVSIVLSGSMAFAYFTVHQAVAPLPLQNEGESAALCAWIFLLLAVVGPGSIALDTLRRRRA